ncbi:MAG: adenylate/guanylate cyclase domain-containing protein [Flavobacteriales bacterium]|nr:adenylate/guanylate cyclase domain-containing protein [Flavobacteriales bacterium]
MNESRPYWGRCTPQLLAPRILSLVNIHIGLHQPDSAGHYLAFADSLAHLAHLPISSVKGEIELDYYHYLYLRARGNDAEADEALERALRSAQQQDLIRYIQKYRKELVTRYRKRGTVQMALDTLMLFTRVNDSLTTDADRKKVASYEGEVKERESALEILQQQGSIRQQRIMLFSIGTGLLLLITLAYSVHRGKKRSDELLLNILPAQVAAELKKKGYADAKHFDHVTVLFTDFKGFTAMSEILTPKELVRDLHECFSAFDRICEKHSIEKIKTIGDAYMAAGGLPTPNTTHATDVIRAALEMRDFIAEGKARKIAAGLPYFEIRIGIHTGPVVAGIVGVKKFSYDIWGDTVNTASRMESSGEVGQVNISEATYALVKGVITGEDGVASTHRVDRDNDGVGATGRARPEFTFTPRGKVQAKGKGEMEMYFVQDFTAA